MIVQRTDSIKNANYKCINTNANGKCYWITKASIVIEKFTNSKLISTVRKQVSTMFILNSPN